MTTQERNREYYERAFWHSGGSITGTISRRDCASRNHLLEVASSATMNDIWNNARRY